VPLITVKPPPAEEEKLTKEDIKRLAEELRDVMSEEIIEEISERRHKKLSYRSGKESKRGQPEGFNDDLRKEVYERNHATVALENQRNAQNASHLSYYEVNMQVMLDQGRLSSPLNGDSITNEMVSVQHHFHNPENSLLAGPNTSLAVISPTPNFDRPQSDLQSSSQDVLVAAATDICEA
jgi:hypothetical protein